MSSGTGLSTLRDPLPAESGMGSGSLLHAAHPIALPSSLSGETRLYESAGGRGRSRRAKLRGTKSQKKMRGKKGRKARKTHRLRRT